MSVVLVERREAVAVVTINRPEKRNALSLELRGQLADEIDQLAADSSVAVVVLTGAGNTFCAGMDRTQFGGDAENRRQLYERSRRLFESLWKLPRPVIAAVNGAALGGGFGLATLCDIRIASPSAIFGLPEIRMGIPSSFAMLRRILPDPVARQIALSDRMISPDQALQLGIVSEVVSDVHGRALALAKDMAAFGAPVLEATKRLMMAAEDPAVVAAWEAEMALFRRALFGPEES